MRRRPAPAARWRERLSGTPRLVLAGLLLAVGTLVALTARAPAATAPVVVTTRVVAAGAVLAAADLSVVRHVRAEQPDGAVADPAAAVGRRVVAALPRGAVLTVSGLAPDGFAASATPGRAVATAAVAAGRAAVVRVGDTVRLVVTAGPDPWGEDPAAAPVALTDDARVLAVWSASGADVATLVVDVDVGSASRLAVLAPDALVGCVVLTA